MLVGVFLGGALGALARTALADAWVAPDGSWPWATWVVNVVGCAVLGAVVTRTRVGGPWRASLGLGLCGGLTTFSTMQVELVVLLDDGHPLLAAAYASTSLVAGVAAYAVGRRA